MVFGLQIDSKIGSEIKDVAFLDETSEGVLLICWKFFNGILKRPQWF